MDNKEFEIDIEEFKLFKKYNNEIERGVRKKNFFYLDNPDISKEEKMKLAEKNKKTLIRESIIQIEDYPRLFEGDGIC